MMFTLAILAVVLSYTWVIEPIAPKSAAAVAGALVAVEDEGTLLGPDQ